MQINHTTQQPYNGENQSALEDLQVKSGYRSNEWLTFLQAKQSNRKIKAGEHGIRLVKVTEREDENGNKQRRIKSFVVFNLDQTEVNN